MTSVVKYPIEEKKGLLFMFYKGQKKYYSRRSTFANNARLGYESVYNEGYNDGVELVLKRTGAIAKCGLWVVTGSLVLGLVSCVPTAPAQARGIDESVYKVADLCGINISQVEYYEDPYELQVEQAKTELWDAFGNLVSACFEDATNDGKINRSFRKAKRNAKKYLKNGEFIYETESGEKYLKLESSNGTDLEFYIYDASTQSYNKEEIAKVICIYDVLKDQNVLNASDLFRCVYIIRGDGKVISCSDELTFYSVLPSGIEGKDNLKSYLSEWLVLNEGTLFTEEEIKTLAKTPNN